MMAIEMGAVSFTCADVPAQTHFWAEALGYEIQLCENDYSLLAPPCADGPRIFMQRVAEPKGGKNRLHLDFSATDRPAEVKRLEAIGARRLATHAMEGFYWTVMADPEGNEFCVADEH